MGHKQQFDNRSAVCRFGPAVRQANKQKGLGSIPLGLYLLFKKVVVCGQCLVILSLTIDDLRKSRGLHSVRAFGHGPACGCSAE